MVKTELKILEHEDKTSSGFDYTRFKCEYDNGSVKWMSAFKKTKEEKQCVEDLKNHENVLISVEVKESTKQDQQGNPYLNLTKFYGKVAGNTQDQADRVAEAGNAAAESIKPKRKEYDKDPIGLAVEVFCGLQVNNRLTPQNAMEISIDLVQQAQKAFS